MEKKIGEQNSSQGRQFVMAATFTRKVVAEHNTVNDAWIIVDDKVYDISRWAFSHPGGRVILFYRGQDATEPVYAFHPDMQRTKRFMKPLYVGDLQEDPKDPLAPHVQDFRQLREDLEKEGYFQPSVPFYLFYLLQIIFFELLGYAAMYYTGSFLLTAFLLAVAQIQAGWQQHDFGHCAVFRSARWNQWIHYVFIGFFKGFLSWWWKSRHNRHHAKTNMIKYDPDFHVEPLFSFSEELVSKPKWKPSRRFLPILPYQKYYWFLFGPPVVTTLMLLVEEKIFMAKRGLPADIIACFLFFIRFDLIFTMMGLSPMQVIGLYFLMRLVETHWFTWVTSMNHLPMPKMEDQKDDWITLQTRATLNVTPGHFADWFTGFLNYQIEHHLFPNMPRHHYPAVAPRVKELCRKHGLSYQSTGIWNSFVLVVRKLDEVGQLYKTHV